MKKVWLNSLFFINTIQFLELGNTKQLSETIYSNYMENITLYFNRLFELINPLITTDASLITKNPTFYSLSAKLYNARWASDVELYLSKLISILENSHKMKISQWYVNDMIRFQQSLEIKTRFSEDSIKKYRQFHSLRNTWNEEQSKVFIDKVLIPFFENHEKSATTFSEYIKWMQITDNFFKNRNGDIVYLSSVEQKDSLSICVDTYVSINGYNYNRNDFIALMDTIFSTLNRISLDSAKSENIDSSSLHNDLESFYVQSIQSTNIIIYQNLYKTISSFIIESINDSLTAYSNVRQLRNWTWSKCFNHQGFKAQILYYLYRRLYLFNEFEGDKFKQLAIDLNNYASMNYHTYISPASNISTSAYIKDNCNIADNVTIKENVYLNNCEIGQNVIINSNTIIDTQYTEIQNDCIISQYTSIVGKFYITIKPSPNILDSGIKNQTI